MNDFYFDLLTLAILRIRGWIFQSHPQEVNRGPCSTYIFSFSSWTCVLDKTEGNVSGLNQFTKCQQSGTLYHLYINTFHCYLKYACNCEHWDVLCNTNLNILVKPKCNVLKETIFSLIHFELINMIILRIN